MNFLYESSYSNITYLPKESLLINRWKPETTEMDEPLFRKEIAALLTKMRYCKPQSLLVDTRNFHFIIAPDLQEWFDQIVYLTYLEIGLKKKAFLTPADLFTKVALEQTNQSSKNDAIKVKFFTQEEEAQTWLSA